MIRSKAILSRLAGYLARAAGLLVWGLALGLTGCGPGKGPGTPPSESALKPAAWFREVARSSGVGFEHVSGHQGRHLIPEMETGGVGLLDFDGDGLLDIFCVNGGAIVPGAPAGRGHRLYRNLGGWHFEDVTERAGISDRGQYGMGCACADFDGDGRVDILVTGLRGSLLFRNLGDGRFEEISGRAGVRDGSWGTSAAFLDFDGDGNLDLMVVNYLRWGIEAEVACTSRGGVPDYCSPLVYKAPAVDSLFRNRGDGTFEKVTHAAGLDRAYGNGLGVVCTDFDGDGWPDLFVANDGMPNQLWMNRHDGTFVDEALVRGCAVSQMGVAEAGMGVAAVDLVQRGRPDLFVTHLEGEGNRLWLNTNGMFQDTVRPRGPGSPSLPLTGFGVVFADFDNDGLLDAYIANGKVKHGQTRFDPMDPYAEPNTLLAGRGFIEFEEVKPSGGTDPSWVAVSRGVAAGDLDNDGGVDLVVVVKDGPVRVLRNIREGRGHWAIWDVRNRNGSAAIGARLEIRAGGRTWWREVLPNQGYCSSQDPRVHVGLGTLGRVDELIIHWAFGPVESMGPFAVDQVHRVQRRGSNVK